MTAIHHSTQSLGILVAPLDEGGLRVTVQGELDALSVDQLAQRVAELLKASEPDTIELDLAGVDFIDAAAAGQLGRLHLLAADVGCDLSITAATQFAWWLFASTGLASTFPLPPKFRWASEPGS